jgi:hypothetical protein
MSSLFVQVTIVATGYRDRLLPKNEIIDCHRHVCRGGLVLAVTRGDPANSSSMALITGVTPPAIRTLFFVICLFPYI